MTARGIGLVLLTASMLTPGQLVLHGRPEAAQADPGSALHEPLDRVLDTYVRDGLVYYRALQIERPPLDRYVASLDVPPDALAAWTVEAQLAFWLNAYDALVLRTVIDHYPINGTASDFPANSVRQVPGAFGGRAHRVAGREVTLDQIETEILAGFEDPRVFLAIGRGAVGGGRLRSEAFSGARLEEQLADAAAECVTRAECVVIDQGAGMITANPLFGWRETAFVSAYAAAPDERFPGRSPIELALVHLILPHVYPGEREFIARNAFRFEYHPFDWSLNDLTGR